MRNLPFGFGLALLWSPLVALVLAGSGGPSGAGMLSARQLGLLLESLAYATSVGVLASSLGLLVALRLWRIGATRRPWVQALLAALVALPATVVATSWMGISGGFGQWWTQGWAPATLVQTLVLLPLAVGVLALSLERLDGEALDAARVARSVQPLFWRVLVPSVWPALAAAGSLAALVALGDFTVPSLFGANPYALEIFAMFSAGEDAVSASWPLFVLALPLAWIAGRWTSSLVASRTPRRAQPPALPGPIELLGRAGVSVAGLAFLSALLILVLQSRSLSEAAAAAAGSVDELWATLRFSTVGALLALIIGAATAPFLAHRGGPLAWALVLAPVAMPPALVGMGLARVGALGAAGIDPALAIAVRFGPFAAAVLALQWARIDPLVLDAGRVFATPLRRARGLGLPLLASGLAAAFALCFAMGLGELGASLLVVPPGQSTLSIRLYNLLHYGASEDVAALALLLAALPAVVVAAATASFARRRVG
ncbi:MAG: hypothetical protein H6534_02245 [Chthonomonadaceae bacterium]|nr:hypothetical protein [Chthonomonadaceae bacterium]